MNVLVTGGAGFVGSHIVDALLDEGADVRVLDREPTAWVDRRADFIGGDVRDPTAVQGAVDGVDAVCHQAAKVGLGVDFGDAEGYVADNDLGTAVLLGALWRRGFAGRVVLASSMVVYGEGSARCAEHGVVRPALRRVADLAARSFEPRCTATGCDRRVAWEPVTEEDGTDPRNVYAATKLHQEHLCQTWAREADASFVALRYHNVYGPRMPRDTPYAGVMSIFRSALAAGEPPQVFEDGGQTRDFVHVRDVARANVLALTATQVGSATYNVASGTPRTVGDVATALSRAFGPGAPRPVVTGQWRRGDVRHVVASPRKAAEGLGFVAQIMLEDGVSELVAAPVEAASTA